QLPGGESAVAGLTIFNQLLWFIDSINALIGAGSVAVIAHYYGEKDYGSCEKSIRQTFMLKIIVGVIFAGIALMFIGQIIDLLGARAGTYDIAVEYGSIMLWGTPLIFVAFSIFTALRGIANPKLAMTIMLASTAFNMILDPLLIFGYAGFPALGVAGAAIASVITYSLVVLVGVLYLIGKRCNVQIHLFKTGWFDTEIIKRIIRVGTPSWIGQGAWSSSMILLTPMVAAYGDKVMSAYGISLQVVVFGLMIVVGAGLGLSSLIGHNIGANKLKRAKITADRAIILSAVIMTLIAIVAFIFAKTFAGFYFTDAESKRRIVEALRIFCIGMPFWGLLVMMEAVYMGVGRNKPAMVANVVRGWGLRVPLFFLLTQWFSVEPRILWYAVALPDILVVSVFWVYYRKGRWLDAKLAWR
ncbi:MAG: MATE family efflux transporter, partial [candidate division Zixibacteria bacterium]|nr:MATE family efflux transporter [candidate division Zixibacteria bacterium]